MRRLFGVLVLIALLSQLVLSYGSGTSTSTHLKLINVLFDASAPPNLVSLAVRESEYPDLTKFRQVIVDAANSEGGHKDPADPVVRYWYGTEGIWENALRESQYPTGAFRDAYTSIGNYAHMIHDATIPAHDRVIFHGYPALYYIAPGGPLLDSTKYATVRSDNLEFVASDYDLSTLPVVDISLATFHASPGAWSNTPQFYNSASPSCQKIMRKLWLCKGEAASAGGRDDYAGLCSSPLARSWGVYSFPEAQGCDVPAVGADLDWYPRRLFPTGDVEAPQTAHNIGRTAMYLAIRLSSEALKRLSKSLPPVVAPLTSRIDGDFAGGASTKFSMQLQDNRTQGVYLTLRDTATKRFVRVTIAAPNLPERSADLDGTLRIPLGSRPASDLTTLPWSDQISITWDGTLAGGTGKIGAGAQRLDVEARDEDGNISTGFVLVNASSPASCSYSISPTAQSFGASGGSGTVSVTAISGCAWTATSSAPFLTITSAASGTGSGTVGYRVLGNSGAARSGPLTIAAQTFTVSQAADTSEFARPFGSLDTPSQGATGVTGSIAVSGWALDDRGVTSVRLFRDPVGSEPPGQVLLGNASFVTGARPDIASAYPTYPQEDRAGWGYLLLTNMLPNRGNGTYTLHVYADDAAGHSTLLGSRTITCTNATAIKPFGAIDTPGQGETVSGSAFVNFGWVLTPLPKSIPVDGSTITVYVDGVPVGHPVFNQYRADIAALFPGLANSNGASGAFILDTTKLANGVHTIAWVVADSAGAAEGIGSRYFMVQN